MPLGYIRNIIETAVQVLRDPASSTALTAIGIVVSIWMSRKRTDQEPPTAKQLQQPRRSPRKRHHKRNKKRVVP